MSFEKVEFRDNTNALVIEPNIDKFIKMYISKVKKLKKKKMWRKFSSDFVRVDTVRKEIWKSIDKFKTSTHPSVESLLKRRFYASVCSGKYLFIHGGENQKKKFNDLIRIDTSNNTIEVFRNLYCYGEEMEDFGNKSWNVQSINDYLYIPNMSRHKMFLLNGGLFIMGSSDSSRKEHMRIYGYGNAVNRPPFSIEMMFYFIDKPYSSKNISCGIESIGNEQLRIRHPKRSSSNISADFVPTMVSFSANLIGNKIYVFGGQSVFTRKAFDALYSLRLRGTDVDVFKLEKKKGDDLKWPSARYGHGSTNNSYGLIFVYGGFASNGEILNDLFSYSVTENKWTEYNMNYLVPPPLAYVTLIPSGLGFTMFGGVRNNGMISKQVYNYSQKEDVFCTLRIMEDCKIISKYGIDPVMMNDTKMMFLGGDLSGGEISSSLCEVRDPSDRGKPFFLMNFLSEKRDERLFTDVIFMLQSGEELLEFPAHMCIIISRAPALGNHLIKKMKKDKNGSYVMEMAKLKVDVFKCFLDFLYTGNIVLEGKENMESLLSFCEKWIPKKDFETVKRLLSKNIRFVDDCDVVLSSLAMNFKTLLDSSLYSDISLKFADGSIMKLHKLFLCRSSYFRNMLFSNFKEAQESEIDFSRFNRGSVLDIITYLYTDKLDSIDPANCIGILIYSLQFELKEISNFCRRIAGEYLTNDNVVDLLNVVEFYRDGVMKHICIKYIVKNYESVCLDEKYGSIENGTKEKIEEKFKKRKMREEKKKRKKKQIN